MNRTETLIHEWNGYYLSNCLPLDHPLRNAVYQNPRNINWETDLLSPLLHKPVTYKFLRIGKLYYLTQDIESEEDESGQLQPLEEELLIAAKTHDHGVFNGLIPEQRVSTMSSVYRLAQGDRVLKSYLTLPNTLTTKSKINKIPIGRRIDGIDFVEARAVEIDRLMPGAFDLQAKIKDFFRDNLDEMALYEKTGATDILAKIRAILDGDDEHWLKVPIPVALDPETKKPVFKITGAEIMRIFSEAIAPISPLEINIYWELFNANFVTPTESQVAIAVVEQIVKQTEKIVAELEVESEFREFKQKFLDPLDFVGIKVIVPLPANNPEQMNWLFSPVPFKAEDATLKEYILSIFSGN